MKITILGFFNKANTGDESYKIAFPLLLPDHELIFTDQIKEPPECLVLGGGDVLNPHFMKQVEKVKGVPRFALSVNLLSETDIDLYLPKFDKMVVRNNVNVRRENLRCFPDFAFILQANADKGKQLLETMFHEAGLEKYDKVIGIVMNTFLNQGEKLLARDEINFLKVCYDLAEIMDTTCASFVLLPFGNGFPTNDRAANSALYTRCKYWSKVLPIYNNLSVQETLDICAACDAVIGTRFHSIVFSCVGGTPFIDLTHHDKTKFLLSYMGKENWSTSYWNLDKGKIKSLLAEFLTKPDIYRNEMLALAARYKAMLYAAVPFV